MAISVKGIQYSYQIDFFNQVPTRVKSQIHDLPVLSVQEPTPIDKEAQASAVQPQRNAVPQFSSPENRQPIAQSPVNRSTDNYVDQSQDDENPALTSVYRPSVNLRLSPAVEAEDFPTADRDPAEPVKGIPKAEYLRAQKAYKPDYGSYLQPTGYEAPLQTGAVQEAIVDQPLTRPLDNQPVPQNRIEMVNSSSSPVTVATSTLPETEKAEAVSQATESDNQAAEQQRVTNFMARQAQRLYEIFATNELVSTSNQVDLFF